MMDEQDFDALLRAELAPPERPADMGFVARVDRTVVAAGRFRAARERLRRQLVSEALAAAALAASAGFILAIPRVQETVAGAPGLGWAGLLALLLCWLLIMRGRVRTLA
jgi:hypothetical protein